LKKVIGFAGCKTTTKECMENLIQLGYKINYLITLTPEQGKKHLVSGYMDLKKFATENNITLYYPEKYSLQSDNDENKVKKLNLDILLVIGWQRLIPKWLLDNLTIGAFGVHGSSEPLPKGRGRSPINWCLVEGKKEFITHLFKYNKDVDAGEIVGIQTFDINEFDSCQTLHFKNRISMNRLLEKHLDNLLNNTAVLTPQPDIEPTFYPKRTAEDGMIDWNKNVKEIYNLIRAVTYPFPGAFSYINGEKILIWNAQPFDTQLKYDDKALGEIVEVFYDKSFVVKAKDSTLFITNFKINNINLIQKGNIISSNY